MESLDQYDNETTTQNNFGLFRYVLILGAIIAMIILLTFANTVRAPEDFKKDTLITVYSGMTTQDLATVLQSNHVIRSEKLFRLILSMRWNTKPVMVGDYIFEKPQPAFTVAYRITHGIYGNSRIKVTFPEGISVKNMADILLKNIPGFPVADFLAAAQPQEGFFFPDTYYFFRTMSAEQVISVISAQFTKEMKAFSDDLVDGKTINPIYGKVRSLKDIITMASILEREANGKDEAKVISGILWKRIQKNMPLQVDATFLYSIQKGSSALTQADLRTDGPYNTYTRTGLPVGPIGNPGTVMIDAALHPTDSPYWYYLHDSNGVIHYAKTYQDHLKNKRQYLK